MVDVMAGGLCETILANAKGQWIYLRAVLGVIGQLMPPESFLEFHMLWDRQGGFVIPLLLGQLISVITFSCLFQEYVDRHVVVGEG